jgi:hypothetical protein
MLSSHKKAVYDISMCRKPAMGGQVYECKECNEYHYSYHSCGNRSCNTCQNNKAEEWFEKNSDLLLPVDYFIITFTLPDDLRHFARSNQKLFYNLLFKCSAESIDKLSTNPKYIGGKPGYLGVLHTWSRTLSYHPHIHYIITAGGLSKQEDKWVTSNDKFLLPVKALSVIFKAKVRDGLKKQNPAIFNRISPDTWTKKWVVNSIPVGNGALALKYLAQYIFRVAISNNRIIKHENGFVTFKYKDSKTKQWKFMRLTAEEFIRRFLQHVLPRGFVKVRYFGLFANKNKRLILRLKELLSIKIEKSIRTNSSKNKTKVVCCLKCGKQMKLIININRGRQYNKPPPLNNFFSLENHLEYNAVILFYRSMAFYN